MGSSTPPAAAAGPAGADARVGTTCGKYRIVRRLGTGVSASVYEGLDLSLERRVAIKFLSDEVLQKADLGKRFLGELRVLARLSHPHIVTLFDVCQDAHGSFLVMELLYPVSAQNQMVQKGPYTWPEATRIIADCCAALVVAHQAEVVHGSINPHNLLFSLSGVTTLTDFGLARLLDAPPELGADGRPAAAQRYLSPEQVIGLPAEARSDLYALGATYYALLTGQPPFPEASAALIRRAQLTGRFPDPRKLVADIPEACVQVLQQAMEKERTARYQSAQELAADLATLLGQGRRHPGKSDGTGDELGPPRRRFLAASALGVAALMGGEYLLLRRPAETPVSPKSGEQQEGAAAPKKDVSAIKIGVLHSLTGHLAVSEHPLSDATLLAIDELNALGGLLGRPLQAVVQDGKSEVTADSAFTRGAARLLEQEKVAVVFGGYGTSGRKFILPYFEKHDQLLFYPPPYEGLEESQQIIYTGSTPNQLGIPAVKWCTDALTARSFVLIGTDGLRAHAFNAIVKDSIAQQGGELIGSHYALIGESEFSGVVKKIQQSQPQVILSLLVGDSNVAFFKTLVEADVTARTLPVLSFSMGENELAQLGGLSLSGHYVASTHFPVVDSAATDTFKTHFQQRYGSHRPVSDVMESAYYGVYLWAAAVQKAGSTAVAAVRQALNQQEYVLGGVRVSVDASTHHTWKVFQVGRIRSDNTVEVVHTADAPLPPIPFPPPRARTEWNTFSKELYDRWGGHWANPEQPRPFHAPGTGLRAAPKRPPPRKK